ncbi:MAG: hypothetical protein IIB89_05575 [Chloroflexi bacterium]|nr:hypothetical protein [Chloroflexota bacterium]
MFKIIKRLFLLSVVTLVLLGTVQGSDSPSPSDVAVAPHKYNLLRWELDHFLDKWVYKLQDILPWNSEPPREARIAQAQEFFDLRGQIRELERELAVGSGSAEALSDIAERIEGLQRQRRDMQPDVEETMESEISAILVQEGFSSRIGVIFPPVDTVYADSPGALIISPRDRIEQTSSTLLKPGLSAAVREELEDLIFHEDGVSALVVSTGGVATYPSVVSASGTLRDALRVTAHEWLHHWFFFQPLGQHFWDNADMTTLNSVNNDGLDLRQFNRELVEYLRGLLLIKTGSDKAVDLTTEDMAELKDLAAKTSLPQILKAVKLFGQLELGLDNYSTLPMELALVDCVLPSVEEKERPIAKAKSELRQPVEAAAPPITPTPSKHPTVKPESVAEHEPTVEPEVTVKAEKPESPAPAPPVTEGVPATPPEPGSEIERLRLNWKQIVNEAPPDIKKTNAIALLRSAGIKPVAIEDDTVVLSFRYNIHKENMEKPENQQVAEKIISGFLGRACRVRCIHEPENNHLVREAQKMGAQVTSVEEK